MSNWFETIVPDNHNWSSISPTNEKISSKDALLRSFKSPEKM